MNKIIHSMVVAAAMTVGANSALAEASFPSKPITIVVPFSAGGPADHIARYVAKAYAEKWNVDVVVENKLGAGGMIGAAEVARSKPDGYTLVELVTGHTIMPGMQANMPYKMPDAFAGVTVLNYAPKVVVTHAASGVTSFKDLLAKVRKDPGKYASYGTSGVGSLAHLAMEQVNKLERVRFVHIPYKGGAATQTDLVAGRLSFGVLDLGSVLPFVESGKLRVLAVTSEQRSPIFPDVPTVEEVVPGFEATEWFGLAAPAGTPLDIRVKLQEVAKEALKKGAATDYYIKKLGWELPVSTPQETDEWMAEQTGKWAKLTKELGLKID